MASHSFNAARSFQRAEAQARRGGALHHIRITPTRSGGWRISSHHVLVGTRTSANAARGDDGPFVARAHGDVLADRDALHDRLDEVLDVAHRPVGQHLAVHVPQLHTQNSDLIADEPSGRRGADDEVDG